MMKWSSEIITQPDGSVSVLSLPEWGTIDLDSLLSELRLLLAEGREVAEQIAQMTAHDFSSLVLAQESIDDRIHRLWGPVVHLSNVLQTEQVREVVKEGTVLLSEYSSDMHRHEGVFRAYDTFATSEAFRVCTPEQKKIIHDALLALRREGALLGEVEKEQLKQLSVELASCEEEFSDHLLDAQETWSKCVTDRSRLSGIPDEVIAGMARDAAEKHQEGFLVTLKQPVVIATLTYATDRTLREEIFIANNARASELGMNPELDNAPLIDRILRLRHEIASLLRFGDFGSLSVDDKSAGSVDVVNEFLERLAVKSFPSAQKEFRELEDFAREKYGIAVLAPWDIAYISEKLRMERFDVSDEVTRPYFPQGKVFQGLFDLLGRLYAVHIDEDLHVPVWHTGVKFFRVTDNTGVLRGGFYADLSARDKKRGGAWMDDCVTRRRIEGQPIVLPVAYLNCNFTAPAEGEEAYVTHGEVETLFHEMGHVMHHVLGLTQYLGSAMLHVEWDAVECPSQLLEYWCWDQEILRGMSAHRETGDPLPVELCAQLIRAKNFGSGMATVRQLEFAMTDMALHTRKERDMRTPRQIHEAVCARVRVTPMYVDDRFLNGFQHIFAGGYSAGYYSYKWAEVLAADIYEAFVESGDVCNREVGVRYRTTILEQGAARPFLESFVEFRGRPASEDALLRQTGLLST